MLDQVLLQELLGCGDVGNGVPDSLRVYDHGWAELATIQAACHVDPDVGQLQLLHALFQMIAQGLGPPSGT